MSRSQGPKIILTAGGTGGHLFPALAVAAEFRRRLAAEVSFITSPKPVTLDILARADFPYQTIRSQALKGVGWRRRLVSLLQLPVSYWQARRLLAQARPDLVIGMGGYVSGPVGLAAWRLGLPLVIHEQNAVMGTTNRYLSRLARKVFLSFPETEGNPAPDKAFWSGNPIRPEFYEPGNHNRPEWPFTLLVMGGSQGAHHLNVQMLAALPHLQELRERLAIIHLSGPADFKLVQDGYRQAGFPAEVYSFSHQVAQFMRRAHLVLCRAGASTLAELLASGRVGVLVPYPYAVNRHQDKNAAYLVEAGAAFKIANSELTGERIAALIKEILPDRQELAAMEQRSRALSRPQAASLLVRECLALLGGQRD